MKVYTVESLECDWDTQVCVEGIFSTLNNAVEYVKRNFSFLEECNIVTTNSRYETVKHYYGQLGIIGEIHVDENGNKYFNYEEDGEMFVEYIQSDYSITIKEWELDT